MTQIRVLAQRRRAAKIEAESSKRKGKIQRGGDERLRHRGMADNQMEVMSLLTEHITRWYA